MSIEAFLIGIVVVYVAGLLWRKAKPKAIPKVEITDMTEIELTEAMEKLGYRYRAMADVIRARRKRKGDGREVADWLKHEGYEGFMSRTVVRKLIEDDDPWDNAMVGR